MRPVWLAARGRHGSFVSSAGFVCAVGLFVRISWWAVWGFSYSFVWDLSSTFRGCARAPLAPLVCTKATAVQPNETNARRRQMVH